MLHKCISAWPFRIDKATLITLASNATHPMCGIAVIPPDPSEASITRTREHCLAVALLVFFSASPQAADTELTKKTADEIRTEALMPNTGPHGHPLPLLAGWNTGTLADGYDPDYQLGLIERGHHLLPWFQLDPPRGPGSVKGPIAYYRKALLKCAELDLPISFLSTQWESLLADRTGLSGASNLNTVNPQATPTPLISPFGPVGAWAEAGRQWTASKTIRQLQAWYPHPPKLVFVSNNEQPKLTWKDADTDRRYLANHGAGTSDEAKRKAVGEGWIERYRALQAGMRDELGDWQSRSIFVGYDAFGSSAFGRWGGWIDYSLHTQNRIEPWPLAWDGASVSYYLNGWEPSTDTIVWSPQVQAMNWLFMLDEAYRLNPGFWFELSTWDGYAPGDSKDKRAYFAKRGQDYTPQRYAGMVKFGMWLSRPRIVREFRGSDQTKKSTETYFLALAEAVDEIHNNPDLKRFWRHGELVANTAHPHPYSESIPAEYAQKNRWFLLDTHLDPARPWALMTAIPVFTLALVIGKPPQREWLVYLHSPEHEYPEVAMSLPGYGQIKLSATPGGHYYHVSEKNRKPSRVDAMDRRSFAIAASAGNRQNLPTHALAIAP